MKLLDHINPLAVKIEFLCKVCDHGWMQKRRLYRMSIPVVLIGYILLIPSILGMLIWAGVVASVIISDMNIPDKNAGELIFAAAFGATGAIIIVSCFVVGLLGWLLVQMKTVLKCSKCGAVVPAS